jgi:ATP-dependent DNA helicase RecG
MSARPVGDEELVALVRGGESDRVERKESWRDANAIREAICAFANDLPGYGRPGIAVVGQRDDGSCAGIDIDDRLLTSLGGLSAENTFAPSPSVEVRRLIVDGCHVAVVIVHPHSAPPVRMRGRAWVRVGPRTQLASPEDERRLIERARGRNVSFDMTAPEEATLDGLRVSDIREEYLPEALDPTALAANQRSVTEQLSGIRFLGANRHPTMGALLAYGIDPQRWVPGAYVQFVRFDGLELTDPIRDQKALSGGLGDILRALDDLLKINITTALRMTDALSDSREPDYPIVALQQLSRNAVMHRLYDPAATNAPVRIYWFGDRIEIQNPGGLYGQVTPANFGSGITDYRNPLVAEIMATLGFVQRFGIGISTARRQLASNGNPDPEFRFEETHVQAVVRCRR